ncbi:hypothetical protein Ddc_12093 [Ditylenchus destructor]|nr:hypothetical protein Ddc_12093 [Ditylenchus destructor]
MRWFYFENGKPYFIYGGIICNYGQYCAATKSPPDYKDFRFFENFGLPKMINDPQKLEAEVFYVPLAPERGDRPECIVALVHEKNIVQKILHLKPGVTKVSNEEGVRYCNYHGEERMFYFHDSKPYFAYQNHYKCKNGKDLCVFYTQGGLESLVGMMNDVPAGMSFSIEYEPKEELTECKEATKKYEGKKEDKAGKS